MNNHDPSRPKAVLIAGPTASGKSALALSLAARLGGTIINADSMQVYRELRILTARPSPEDEARVPHRLYGAVSVSEPFSVARWLGLAQDAIAETQATGRLPIFVGGTGLYFHALTEGLADIPPIPAPLREAVRAQLAAEGSEALHAALAREDPDMAARLKPGDRQRIARALEVIRATGRSLSIWQAGAVPPALPLAETLPIVLMPPRAGLYAAIDARVLAMIEAGAPDEVQALEPLGIPEDLPALKALGVGSLRALLAGRLDREEAVLALQTSSRHYAKRQMTWFRNRMIAWRRMEKKFSESMISEILSFMPNDG